MIHIVKIDDKTPTGKRLIKELHKHHKIVEFKNPAETGFIPEGYMTSDEFFTGIQEKLRKRSQENGLLQQNCSK